MTTTPTAVAGPGRARAPAGATTTVAGPGPAPAPAVATTRVTTRAAAAGAAAVAPSAHLALSDARQTGGSAAGPALSGVRTPTPVPPLPAGVEVTTLDNGVRVVSERLDSVRSVSVGVWVGVGSRHERSPLEGATHFLEHLLFKGTTSRSALELAQAMDAVGGDMNAFTSKEYTAYHARCLDRDLGLAVELLGDMLTASTILPEEVENERDVVLEELRMHLDDPGDLVHSEFSEAVYGEHPLGREVIGSVESMTAMTRDQVAGWWSERYGSDVLCVAAAGNLDHDALVRDVALAFDDVRPLAEPLPDEPSPTHAAEALRVRVRPVEQSHVVLGTDGLPRGHELRWAMAVLNQAFGGGMASRLFQEIRERRGLAYSTYSFPISYADSGTFGIYAGTSPEKTAQVVDVARAEVERLRTGGLDADELERAKGYLTGSTVMALEDTSSRMSRLGRALTTSTPLLGLDELMAVIDAVTADDVAEVADLVLSGDWTTAVVGPADADEMGLG